MGRTGQLFAHEWAGITPDIVATAKGIGGGFPAGACLATDKVAKAFVHGSHGAPSVAARSPWRSATPSSILSSSLPGFLEQVQRVWRAFPDLPGRPRPALPRSSPRPGQGLMQGLKCAGSNTELVDRLRAAEPC